MLTFFGKTRNLQLMSIEKRPSMGFIPISKYFCLKYTKFVELNHYCFRVSVCALILSNFMRRLINWEIFCIKASFG